MRGVRRRLKGPLLLVMGPMYVVAGIFHFLVPGVYVQIVPPVFPAPSALVYLSGLAEIAVGIGLLIPRKRRYAACAMIALLVAVFPANVYMATSSAVVEGIPGGGEHSALSRWGRLPLQAVLVLWAFWYT